MHLKKFLYVIGLGIGVLFSTTSSLAVTQNTLDRRAQSLSYENGQSVEDIVKALTADLTDNREKAYILAVFMAYQFQRNGYAERELKKASLQNKKITKLPPNDFLKTRIGTSQDFAALYQNLCEAAGLESIVIQGYAGKNIQAVNRATPPTAQVVRHSLQQLTGLQDYRMQQYEASWNAVKLGDKWILVDTYWMISGPTTTAKEVQNQAEMERLFAKRLRNGIRTQELIRNKKIDQTYFDASPRLFIKTHYPLDPQWQLLNPPVSWRSFLR